MNSVYQQRRSKLLAQASNIGFHSILLVSTVNILYYTGIQFSPMKRLLTLVLNVTSGSCALILPAMESGRLYKTGIDEIPYSDTDDPFKIAKSFLVGRIGVEKNMLSLDWAERLCEQESRTLDDLGDVTPTISFMRMFKDQDEIRALHIACKKTDSILDKWSTYLRPGVTQQMLRFRLDEISAANGVSESCPGIIIALGVNSSMSHGLSFPHHLTPHEPLYVDCGARNEGYYCDITRSFFVGSPDPEFAQIYKIVLEAQQAAIEDIRPGIPLCQLDSTARTIIDSAGYGAYFNHRLGHGLGLEVHEMPNVSESSIVVAQPGMVFTIEPGIYLPGRGGIRIEDDVLVTDSGVECLTNYPKTLSDITLPL